MELVEVDCLVIGAGVVGLAVDRELALHGQDVLVLDQEADAGMHTSSRNSEVIHAGIYYPAGSLKAELCVRGRQLLYDYCRENFIPFKQCGKLIVANNSVQEVMLRAIQQQALANGVDDVEWLTRSLLIEKEPELEGGAALFSPSTGIIDSHAYMLQLQADIARFGGQCVFNSKVSFKQVCQLGIELVLNGGEAKIVAKKCINSAGLSAISLLSDLQGFPADCLPQAFFAKGSYFSYASKVPFRHLVYPMPESGGLGVHLTLDMQGRARFGPDVEWLEGTELEAARNGCFDYHVDTNKGEQYVNSISEYWQGIDITQLVPNYAGVRPKISDNGRLFADFVIQGEVEHGIKGLINLFGVESPGLTSSLAIAEKVCALICE
jgi:L-2-hydroxyglutarate oxidase LhgO